MPRNAKAAPHRQQELYDISLSIRLSERKYKLVENLSQRHRKSAMTSSARLRS